MAKLFEIFGDFRSLWPSYDIQDTVGLEISPTVNTWLNSLNEGVELRKIRTGAEGDRLMIEAIAELDNGPAPTGTSYTEGFPVVFTEMPDVEIRLHASTEIHLFISISARGAEVVLENLEAEIRLPIGLVDPPNNDSGEAPAGTEVIKPELGVGEKAEVTVHYRKGNPTSIHTQLRIHVDEDGEIRLQTPRPISFEACLFSGLAVKAVHDFVLIPSPKIAKQTFHWVRHSLEPFIELPEVNGMFGIRSLHLDHEKSPLKELAEWMNQKSENEPQAEFVLEDLVVPFYSIYVLPIPRHITIGIRKLFVRFSQLTDPQEFFHFNRAPVVTFFNKDPVVALIIRSLFYRSLPSETIDEDLGLTFSAGVAFGGKLKEERRENPEPAAGGSDGDSSGEGVDDPDELDSRLISIGLGEQYTIFAGYQGLKAVKLEIAGLSLNFLGFKLGYSIGRHIELAKKGEDGWTRFGKSVYATLDMLLAQNKEEDDSDSDKSLLSIRSINNKKVEIILEGIGWDRGDFTIKEKISMPDGIAIWIADLVAIVIEEMGLLTEQGAGYFSFSGGVLVDTSGFDGGFIFKRMRFRISGNESAPPFNMDGFFVNLKNSVVNIEAGGYYTRKELTDGLLKEFGFTGKVTLKDQYVIGLDLIKGKMIPNAGGKYDFFLIQVFFRNKIPAGTFELVSIRALFAWNMQPKLDPVDREARELRYYNWHKRADPMRLEGNRRLSAWKPIDDAWALGVGASVSFAGLGSILELSLFVMGIDGPAEAGLLAALELFVFGSIKPIGYAVLELDFKNDRYSFLLGVDIKVSNFVKDPPDWLDEIAKISGTLFISNDPGTVALGRLKDGRTWFGIELKYDVWIAAAYFRFALCFEWVDGEIIGFGIIFRFEGGGNAGIIRFSFNLGFGLLVAWFRTGSSDYAVAVWIEGGLRVVLFGFLRFGISAKLEFRNVGEDPSRSELTGEFRFETPWFLPDITWSFEESWGTLSVEDLGAAAGPLRRAAASDYLKRSLALHSERFDANWDGEGVAPLYSVKRLKYPARPESQRLSGFAANTSVLPIATDVTIQIEWTTPISDRVLPGPLAGGSQGDQESGDINLRYEFVDIQIRRRARFGSSSPWVSVDHHTELSADFSDSDGVSLGGSYNPAQISMVWDPDVTVSGKPAPKRLLINAKTPYEYVTQNPERDEEIIRDNPNWPCCDRGRDKYPNFESHKLDFHDLLPGQDIEGPQLFSDSDSQWVYYTESYVHIPLFGTNLPPGSLVGYSPNLTFGLIGGAFFDEPVAYILIRMAWLTRKGHLRVVVSDATDEKHKTIDLASASNRFETIAIGAPFPIRRLEVQLVFRQDYYAYDNFAAANFAVALPTTSSMLYLDCILYVGVNSWLDNQRQLGACGSDLHGAFDPYQGRGKLSFLPNHEYEIAITTRVTIQHPSDEPDPSEVQEFVYFKTKGLPGLNAVNRVGEEVEPYVANAYQGGHGWVYREEPVAIAFTEDFHVAVPLAVRPSGTIEEHTTLMEMQLLVRPDVATSNNSLITTTATDWIVDNRSEFLPPVLSTWLYEPGIGFTRATRMISQDPMVMRLATLTQRPAITCELDDPLDVTGTVLIAQPQGSVDPEDETRKLWLATTPFNATVRIKGAPFIGRDQFVAEDLTAFDFANDTSSIPLLPWTIVKGKIHANTEGREFALFGEDSWNHLDLTLTISLESGMAGIGVSLPGSGVPSRGLFVVLQRSGEQYLMRFAERNSGIGFNLTQPTVISEDAVNPDDPVLILQVTAFDDILRATIGDQFIELQREAFREGRMALWVNGKAYFYSLFMKGIDIYSFPFQVSRFISFEQHIQSFSGDWDLIDASMMGAAATPDVAALHGSSRAQVLEVMHPAADQAARQLLFDQWQQHTALPLKDELTNLELSQYRIGDKTAFFFLESPEPMDFTEEIQLRLIHRVRRRGGGLTLPARVLDLEDLRIADDPFGPIDPIGPIINPEDRFAPRLKDLEERQLFREAVLFREDSIDNLNAPITLPPTVREPSPAAASLRITDVLRTSDIGLQKIFLNFEGDLPVRDCEQLVFLEKGSDGNNVETARYYQLTMGSNRQSADLPFEVDTARVILDEVMIASVEARFRREQEGTIYLIHPDWGLVDIYRPRYEDREVDVLVLQDASRTRALIIPESEGSHKPLDKGKYRLHFSISKARWLTTDVTDVWNTYEQESVIPFEIY